MEPTIRNSKTKIGVMISGIVSMALLLLPEFGVHIQETLVQKVLVCIDIAGGMISMFGLRNAIAKNLEYVVTGKLPEKEVDPAEPHEGDL